MKAESLRIRVTEAGETRVDLTFGAESACFLMKLVPPHVRTKLASRSIDLEAISTAARESNFAPGELFLIDDGPKCVRGWLE